MGDDEHSCKICDRTFGSKKALNSHKGQTHPDEYEPEKVVKECKNCGDKFANEPGKSHRDHCSIACSNKTNAEKKRKLTASREKLERLYWEEEMSLKDIASKLDVAWVTVQERMKELDIELRSISEATKLADCERTPEGKKRQREAASKTMKRRWEENPEQFLEMLEENWEEKRIDFSDEEEQEIVQLYEEGYSTFGIGDIFEISAETVKKVLRNNGVEIRDPLFGPSGQIECRDGHKADSSIELAVDNYLYERNISHQIHKPIPDSRFQTDFYIPPQSGKQEIWIEVWGLENASEDYRERMQRKKEHYKEKGLNLLEIHPQDDWRNKLRQQLSSYNSNQAILEL